MQKTLYQRLGGAAGISKIVDDLVEAHLDNPQMQARFVPYLDRPNIVASVTRHTRDLLGGNRRTGSVQGAKHA